VQNTDQIRWSSWRQYGGTFLFLAALVFYYFSVLHIDYKKSGLLDLRPGPDAAEYFAQSRALASGHLPLIEIGRERLPSAFPPGYPAMIVPWLKLLPEKEAVLGPFRTSQTLGLLMLTATFAFYFYLRMPLEGGIASVLLASLPGFWTFARSSMSDTTGWFFYALSAMFAYLGLKEEIRWKIYVSAALVGLSMNLRLQSVFLAPLLLAMPLFPVKGNFRLWFSHCVGAALIFFLAASPFLLLNFLEFHAPLKIGGNFWYPPRRLFALEYIPTKNLSMFWNEFTLQSIDYRAANIFGTGTVFVPAFVFLIVVGLAFVRVNRATLCIGAMYLVFFVLTAAYLYPDGRYYLQLLMLMIPLAVLPVAWAFDNLLVPNRAVVSFEILILFLSTSLGYPSRSGHRSKGPNRAQTWDATHFFTWQRKSIWWEAENNFAHQFGAKPGIVFSDIDPVYLNAMWPESLVAAPVDENQMRRWSPTWRYGRAQATALAQSGIEQSIPVYGLIVWPKEEASTVSRLPKVPGYRWSRVPTPTSEIVYQLVRESS